MKYLISILSLLFIFSSCKNVTGEQQDKLMDEVMNLHDEIMVHHEKLYNLSKELKLLVQNNAEIPGGFTKEEVMDAANHTEQAHKDMSDWMANFQPPDNLNQTDKANYLKGEKAKLEKLKENTNRALKEAEAIIKVKK